MWRHIYITTRHRRIKIYSLDSETRFSLTHFFGCNPILTRLIWDLGLKTQHFEPRFFLRWFPWNAQLFNLHHILNIWCLKFNAYRSVNGGFPSKTKAPQHTLRCPNKFSETVALNKWRLRDKKALHVVYLHAKFDSVQFTPSAWGSITVIRL